MLLLLLPVLSGCSKEEEAAAKLAILRTEYEAADGYISDKRVAFAPRYQSLVKDYWGTEAALEASLWLMEKAAIEARESRADVVAEFTDSILVKYARSPALGKVAEHVSIYTEDQREHYFGEVLQASPHPAVRAAATFFPAKLRIRTLRPRPRPPGMPELRGAADAGDPEALEAVEAALRRVMEEYGDVPRGNSTYGVMADAALYPLGEEDLAVGRTAPEIVGTTVDGEEMRLSDFRGKVTVIDFWGDW